MQSRFGEKLRRRGQGNAQATHLPPPGKDDSVALASRNKRLFPTPETSQEPRRALFTRSGAHSRLEVLWKRGVDSVGPGWLRVCVSNKAAIPGGLLGGSRAAGVGLGCELIRAGKNGGSRMAR